MKRTRERKSERRKKREQGFLSCLLFSFVSLESFPLPPLEETAAPATHTQNTSVTDAQYYIFTNKKHKPFCELVYS